MQTTIEEPLAAHSLNLLEHIGASPGVNSYLADVQHVDYVISMPLAQVQPQPETKQAELKQCEG